jgi:tRNA dimethylallyltransferase
VLALLGPTASGKTEVASRIAQSLGAEILSVDSMQVYRGLDIGTAKPTWLERHGVTHHMVDIVEPEEEYTVAQYRSEARRVMAGLETVLISGGSGLHFRALVDPMSFAPSDPSVRAQLGELSFSDAVAELIGLDPDAGLHVDLQNPRRVIRALEICRLTGETPSARAATAEAESLRRYEPEIPFTAVGIDPGEGLDKRIELRMKKMKQAGLVEEVRALQGRLGRTARAAVGYRELADALEGLCSVDEAIDHAIRKTKKLARRQRTWFQRDPRIRWIPWLEDPDERAQRVSEAFQ